MIDGKALYGWFQEGLPEGRRYEWEILGAYLHIAWNALAERINAEMGRPLIIEEGAIQVNLPDLCKPGTVVQIPLPTQRVPGRMKDCYLTREQMEERDRVRAKEIKAASKRIFEDAIKYTLVASGSSSNEYSTHHKSCALRHDGIACTCP